jgi:hypothetical protein
MVGLKEVQLHTVGYSHLHCTFGGRVEMSEDVHHRAEGDVTGLRAASRAGAHVSCATRQESVIVFAYKSGITPV